MDIGKIWGGGVKFDFKDCYRNPKCDAIFKLLFHNIPESLSPELACLPFATKFPEPLDSNFCYKLRCNSNNFFPIFGP